jgi:hypothetical protein
MLVDIVSVAQLLSALGTLLLAGLTVANVRLTRRTVGEMQTARIAQHRPQVIVDVDLDNQYMLDVVVKNIGGGAAKDITFEFSHPLVQAGSAEQKPPLSELDHFRKGIDFLAPGAQIRTAWGTYPSLVPVLNEKGLEEGITITSKYKWVCPVSTDCLPLSYSTSSQSNLFVL